MLNVVTARAESYTRPDGVNVISLGTRPPLRPPGVQHLRDGRSCSVTFGALAAAAKRSKKATDAEGRGDHAEAKRLWKIILGDDFLTN